MESVLYPCVTAQGSKGGTYGTLTDSSQGNANEIASVEESKHPTLTDISGLRSPFARTSIKLEHNTAWSSQNQDL